MATPLARRPEADGASPQVPAAVIFLFLRAVLALVAAVAQGGRARPSAQRRERARPRPGSGRPAGPGGRG